MKKLVFAALMLASVSCFANNNTGKIYFAVKSVNGKHIPASQVPAAVLSAFNQQFPTAKNVRWEREREHGAVEYKADFTVNGKNKSARYAADGTPGTGGGGN